MTTDPRLRLPDACPEHHRRSFEERPQAVSAVPFGTSTRAGSEAWIAGDRRIRSGTSKRPVFSGVVTRSMRCAVLLLALPLSLAGDPAEGAETPDAGAVARRPIVFLTPERLSTLDRGTRSPAYSNYKALVDAAVADPVGYRDVELWHVALMSQLSRNPRYCDFAVKRVDEFVSGDHAYRQFAGERFLRAADILQNVLLTYDWCHSRTSPSQRSAWSAYANGGIDRLWRSNDTFWPFDDAHNNYWYSFLEATMLVALVTADSNPRASEFLALTRSKLEKVFLPQWSPPRWSGGGGKEGTHYDKWHRRLWRTLAWWRDATGEDYFSRIGATIPEQINYWMHQLTPDRNHLFQWGDEAADSTGVLGGTGRLLFLTLIDLAPSSLEARQAKDLLDHSPWSAFDRRADRPWDFLLAPRDTEPSPIEDKADLYLHTPAVGSGKTFIRSSWSKDASAVSYSYRARLGPSGSHDHVDKPGFQWFANGEFVVIDPNYYSRSGIVGTSHGGGAQVANMVRVEGMDSDSESATPPKVLHAWDRSQHIVPFYYHSLDMRSIWPRTKSYRRDYVFIPPNGMVVFDRISAAGPKVWQVNTTAAPVVTGAVAEVRTARNRLRVRNLLPGDEIVSVQNWAKIAATDTEFSGGFRLSFTDKSADSVSVKVLDLGSAIDAASCRKTSIGASCSLSVGGKRLSIDFVEDERGALFE